MACTYKLQREQLIKKPREEVFLFFSRPENLVKITPKSMGFKILTPPPIRMQKGAVIDYTVKILGIEQRWTSIIADYEEPHFFTDIQLRGPYSFWHHTHRFLDVPEGTLIEDNISYRVPFGFLGGVIQKALIQKQLDTIFDYRQKVIKDYFGQ